MMQWALAAAALLAQQAAGQNMLRFACSQLVVDRVDPLVNPGMRYTPHLHQIVGGDSFNITMDETHDLPSRSKCTSCSFREDLSNYWTAVMFFQHKNGSYTRVPQVGNGGPQGKLINDGGTDIYYIPSGKVTAFTKVRDQRDSRLCPCHCDENPLTVSSSHLTQGFRMLAGDAGQTQDSRVSKQNICHRCWTSPDESRFVGLAPCSGDDTVAIPQDPRCKMIRQTIIYPWCWDGKNLDSPDHKAHVAYGQGMGVSGGGPCPASHPVKLPVLMLEVRYLILSAGPDDDANAGKNGNRLCGM